MGIPKVKNFYNQIKDCNIEELQSLTKSEIKEYNAFIHVMKHRGITISCWRRIDSAKIPRVPCTFITVNIPKIVMKPTYSKIKHLFYSVFNTHAIDIHRTHYNNFDGATDCHHIHFLVTSSEYDNHENIKKVIIHMFNRTLRIPKSVLSKTLNIHIEQVEPRKAKTLEDGYFLANKASEEYIKNEAAHLLKKYSDLRYNKETGVLNIIFNDNGKHYFVPYIDFIKNRVLPAQRHYKVNGQNKYDRHIIKDCRAFHSKYFPNVKWLKYQNPKKFQQKKIVAPVCGTPEMVDSLVAKEIASIRSISEYSDCNFSREKSDLIKKGLFSSHVPLPSWIRTNNELLDYYYVKRKEMISNYKMRVNIENKFVLSSLWRRC